MIGQVLKKRYELLQELGRSAFAVTHLAHDRERDRRCVVKLLSLRRADGPKVHELFEREAAVLARLEHPRVPRFLDFFTEAVADDLLVVLVQEYVAGSDLFRLVQSGRHFTESQVVEIGIALAATLEYLHAFEPPILHRDVKPSNVLLAEDGTPWLVDFGSVRDKVRRDPLLAPGGPTVVGTFGYMPVEQAQGVAVPASDVSSLAATLVFLLSGKEPWELEKTGLAVVLRGQLQVSPRLLRALEQALEPDWRRRTPTARAFREALERAARPQPRLGAGVAVAAALGLAALVAALLAARAVAPARIAATPRPPPRADVAHALPAGVKRLGVPAFRHGGPARAVAFLPEGTALVSGGDDATLSLWDLPQGQERWRLRLGGAVRALAVSGGAAPRLAVATDSRHPLWLLQAEDGHPLARLVVPIETPYHVVLWGLAFARDGTTLATAANSGRVDLWRATDGAHQTTARPCAATGTTLVAARAGGGFVVSCEGRDLVVLDAGLVEVRRLQKPRPTTALLPMPAGDAVGLLLQGRDVAFVDLESGAVRKPAVGLRLPEGIEGAALSADGQRLALGLQSGAVIALDLTNGSSVLQVEGHFGPVRAVAFSADGARLASASDDHRVAVWSLTGGSAQGTPGPLPAPPGSISALAFAANGRSLFAATSLGLLSEWGLADGHVATRELGGPVSELGLLDDGRVVAAVGERTWRVEESARRLVVHDPAGRASRELVLPAGARGLALAEGRRAITGGATRIDVWDLSTGKRESWPVPSAERPVALTADGAALATLREPQANRGRHTLVLRDGRSGAEVASPAQREGGPFPVACSGARADHVLYDGRLWRVVGTPAPALVALGTAVGNACVVSPDGRWLAVRDQPWGKSANEPGERIVLHAIPPSPVEQVRPLALAAVLGAHRGPVGALAFSPDSRVLASGGADGSVLLWELATVLEGVKRSGALAWPAGPAAQEPVWSLAFDDDDAVPLRWTADAKGRELDRGVVGRALFTDVELALEGPPSPVATGEWTFAAWFTAGAAPTARPLQPLMASPFLSLDVRSGRPLLFLQFVNGGHASVDLSKWSGAWAAGQWHHLAIVRSRAGETRICVDAICGPGPDRQAFADPAGPVILGPRPGQASDRIGVDELRVYSRALSDPELAAEARSSHLRPLPTPTPARPAGVALEATPEPIVPIDASPLVVLEPHPELDVLRFTGPMSTLELFDIEVGGGRVWVGTNRGLLEHDPARGLWRLHGKAAGLPGERLFQIAYVGGRVVVDSVEITRPGIGEGRGTHVFDPATDRFSPIDLGSGVWHLSGEGDQVWIGRSTGVEVRPLAARGPVLLEAAPGRVFTRANGALQHDAVHRIAFRPESVWFASMGTWQRDPQGKAPGDGFFLGGGVSMWDRARDRFERWGVEAGLADGYCAALAVDDAEVWVTHFRDERGVSRLDRRSGRWQAFHTGSNGEKLGGISVALTRDHAWVGSQNGLLQIDRKTLVARRFRHQHRLPGHILYGIAEGFGALWVTVYGQANREPEGWRTQAGMLRIPQGASAQK